MTEELKLCPFCGGKGELFEYNGAEYSYFTPQCSNRWCIAGDEGFYSKLDLSKENKEEQRQEAIKAWNQRT